VPSQDYSWDSGLVPSIVRHFAWQSIATVETILTQLCLNAIEDFLIDDCLVLSLVKIGLVLDLSTVDWDGQ